MLFVCFKKEIYIFSQMIFEIRQTLSLYRLMQDHILLILKCIY